MKTVEAKSKVVGAVIHGTKEGEEYQHAHRHEIYAPYGGPGHLQDQQNLEDKKDGTTINRVTPTEGIKPQDFVIQGSSCRRGQEQVGENGMDVKELD